MAIPLSLCPPSKPPHQNLTSTSRLGLRTTGFLFRPLSRRAAILEIAAVTLSLSLPVSAKGSSSPNVTLDGISNTRSWFQFFGDGFSIRVPPLFEDVMEPEDYSAGQTFYGDKAKPKTFAARFESPDRSEVLSVVIRPSNQLKITFLEAKDITDIGSLKESAKIFVPGGANLYAARTYRIKEEEALRTYYFYEFGIDGQHIALAAGLDSGKVMAIYRNITPILHNLRHTLLEQLPHRVNGKMMVLSCALPHYLLRFYEHLLTSRKLHQAISPQSSKK